MIQAEFSRGSNETDQPSSSCFTNSQSSAYENIDCSGMLRMDLNSLNDNSYHSQPQCQDRTGGLPYAGNYALQVAASIASGDICSALILRSDSRKYTKKSSGGSSKDSSKNQSTLPSTRCSTLRSFLSSSRSSSSGGTLKKEAKDAKEKKGFFSFFQWFRRKKLKRSRLDEDDYRRRRSSSVQSDTSISSSFHYVPVVFNSALSTGNSPIGDKKFILREIERKREEKEKLASVSNENTADESENKVNCQNEENENIESVETNWGNVIHDSLKTSQNTSKYNVEMTYEGASSSGIESNAKKNRTRRSSTSTLHKKKRRAPPPPHQIKNNTLKCQIENEVCLLPTSIANDSLNKKAIRQIKEKARLKKKRRAPSPPYKTIGINTEEISQEIASSDDGSFAADHLAFGIQTDDLKENVHEVETETPLNDLSKGCEGAEASAELKENIKDDNTNEYQNNCLRVTEEWKMGNITTQKLIDMFNEMANCNETESWNISPVQICSEEINKKESSIESDEVNTSADLKSKVLKDKTNLLGAREKIRVNLNEPTSSKVEVLQNDKNFKTLGQIRNLDEVEACIEALTSSFSDDAYNDNKNDQETCELQIYENTMERKLAYDENKSSNKQESYDNSKLAHLQKKWKLNNKGINSTTNNTDSNSINCCRKSLTSLEKVIIDENHRKKNNPDERNLDGTCFNSDLNIVQTKEETSGHCTNKYQCSGARPRLPQKNSKSAINSSSNYVSKIRCNLADGNLDKTDKESKVGRNFSASFSSAYRSRSQIDTRRNSNPNSSLSSQSDDPKNNKRSDLLQQNTSTHFSENHQRRDRKKIMSSYEGKKTVESNGEICEKVKVTAPRRSNLRRHRRHVQKSMYELQENNRDCKEKGSPVTAREMYKKSQSLSSAYRSLGADSLNSETNLNESGEIKKRASYVADVETSRLLVEKTHKNIHDSLVTRASVSASMAAKMVIKGQLWPSSYELIAPELMFLRARLSGRKLPRLPRGDFASDEMNAVEINKLLKQLELAISNGLIDKASNLARKLAEFKVNCSVVRKKSKIQSSVEEISVNLFIEDRLSHTGPITLYINPTITVGQLKKKIEEEFDFPTYLQKWILGKKLATDDSATISSFNVKNGCAVFLYLTVENPDRTIMYRQKLEAYLKVIEDFDVDNLNIHDCRNTDKKNRNTENHFYESNLLNSPAKKEEKSEPVAVGWNCPECTLLNDPTRPGCLACTTARPDNYQIPPEYKLKPEEEERLRREKEIEEEYRKEEERRKREKERYKAENYQHFIELDNQHVVANLQTFECAVCYCDVDVGDGITIRECLHNFCRNCIANTIEYSETAEIKCPYRDDNYSCEAFLQDREIRAIVTPDVYEKHLQKSMITAENQAENSFHCQTADCPGWCIYEDDINHFLCPVCNHQNCLTCIAIHEGVNCKQFQERLEFEAATNEDARKTKEVLNKMLREGNGMHCPKCGVIIMKKMGCDWLMCTMCREEICWVTKGPRWGAGGKGDVSGGCRCGVNGKKCHFACQYCH